MSCTQETKHGKKNMSKTQDETPESEQVQHFLTLQPLQWLISLLQAETAEVVTSLVGIPPSGCLGDLLGDKILPSYVGITINHYKDPYKTTSIMERKSCFFFFRGSPEDSG